jgi:hypothetical protein
LRSFLKGATYLMVTTASSLDDANDAAYYCVQSLTPARIFLLARLR